MVDLMVYFQFVKKFQVKRRDDGGHRFGHIANSRVGDMAKSK
jgi:hypothetical protein